MSTKTMADEGIVKGAGDKVMSATARTRGFLADVRTEMRKVTNPSPKEVRATTMVVIVTVFLFGVYFFVIDSIVGRAVDYILQQAH